MNKYAIKGVISFDNYHRILKIMKITAVFLFLGIFFAHAGTGYSQGTKLTLNLRSATIREVCEQIENQSNFIFVFSDNAENAFIKKINISANSENIEEILKEVFSSTGLTYKILDKQVVVYHNNEKKTEIIVEPSPTPQQEQTKTITGKVTDPQGEPLPGATVMAKGTTIGAMTDAEGAFSLRIPANAQTLQISFVGMKTQEIAIGKRTTFNVKLEEEAIGLQEVVAVGYGVQKKATVTGAISSIDSRVLIQSPEANISNSLAGRLPGLLSVQREGEPGNNQATLRIRGDGTFSGSADPLVLVDGIESLNFNNIDPNEIEDVAILKDASATAVFGVRGANGVILITTKRGKISKPILNFSANVATKTFTDIRENLGSYDYARYYNEGLKYNSYLSGSYSPRFSDEDIEHYKNGDDPIFHPNTNWVDQMLKPFSTQNQYNINIRGGGDFIKYFVSAGYFTEEGLFNTDKFKEAIDYDPNIYYRRYNFRSNFDFDITKRLTAKIDFSSQIDDEKSPGTGNDLRYIVNRTFISPPFHSPGIVDGKIVNVYDVFVGNPLQHLLVGFNNDLMNYVTTSVRFDYKLDFITKGLTAHGILSYWNRMNHKKTFGSSPQIYKPFLLADGTIMYGPQNPPSRLGFGESSGKSRKTYLEFGVNYARTFGVHDFTGLLLYNQDKLYDPNLPYVIPNGHQGLVGRATYNFKNRYLGEFNFGYNGTENFASGKRFGFFPAYSLGWIVSEEPFFPESDAFSYLKIRGAYGEVGNDKIGGSRFIYLPGVFVFQDSYNLGVPGSTFQQYGAAFEGQLGNPDLTWERAKKSDIGIDVAFFNDKLRITADYFYENRDNILATPRTTPIIVGVTLGPQNWGKMKNSGYDAELNFRDRISNFNYWIKGTFTYAHNEILFQDEVDRKDAPYLLTTGQSKGQMFGYIADGFYNTWEEVNDANRPVSSHQNNKIMPGDLRFKDINGDGRIDSFDQVPIGYPNFPEIIYGLSFGGEYQAFDFSVLFQGADHVSRMNAATAIRPFETESATLAYVPELSWTPEKYLNGEEIKLPHLSAAQQQSHDYASSTFMVQDASYLRLKNIEVGYTFQSDFLKRLQIAACRIYLNGNNLFTWDGLFPGDDPEQLATSGDTGYYPLTRTFNLGINVQF